MLWLRRYPEAQVALDRALALAPTNLSIIELKAQVALARGDHACLLRNYWDLYWVLDDAQQRQLLTLPPSAFDGDRGAWAIVRAQTD